MYALAGVKVKQIVLAFWDTDCGYAQIFNELDELFQVGRGCEKEAGIIPLTWSYLKKKKRKRNNEKKVLYIYNVI